MDSGFDGRPCGGCKSAIECCAMFDFFDAVGGLHHCGHALEHRFFRWDRNGVNEQFPWDRGDTQDSLAIKVRIPGRSEMKQLNVHDLICYTYKLPISLVGREWSDSYLVHHGGPGLHFDSRLQHLHMQSRSEHSRHAGSKRRRRSDGGRRKLCSVNCPCVSAKA